MRYVTVSGAGRPVFVFACRDESEAEAVRANVLFTQVACLDVQTSDEPPQGNCLRVLDKEEAPGWFRERGARC